MYNLKRIRYKGEEVSIVTQNENGPCPLIAVMNVLLLRGAMEIDEQPCITHNELLHMLSDYLVKLPNVRFSLVR